jgi:hypothetical protein
MESEIEQTHISSGFFDKERFQKQLDIIKQASELAQAKTDYVSAHDDNVIRAIDVVEDFLKKQHRLCYGGQAINAHLPAKYKFYDPEYSIPDYDFFTPNQERDISLLVKMLKKAGFLEISAREGMHEGTIKIYVDYVPVADMTSIDPKLYRILSKREYRVDGISYLDANTLRMLMYLELSRPRGEVSRWGKVFERLALFNEFVPVRQCQISKDAFNGGLTEEQTKFALDFVIQNKRIFAGGDLLSFYGEAVRYRKQHSRWILGSKKPVIFFSPDTDADSKILRDEFNIMLKTKGAIGGSGSASAGIKITGEHNQTKKQTITIKTLSSKGVDLIPSLKVVAQGSKALVILVDQTACHAYFNVPLHGIGKIIRIASLDTLITLYFGLGLLDSSFFDMGSMECLANKLVEISIKARRDVNKFPFPFISIKCVGHQTSLPSLIREKVRRITLKKKQLKAALVNQDVGTATNIKKIINSKSVGRNYQSTVKNLKKLITQGI